LDNPKGGELDQLIKASAARRIFLSFLSCIVKQTKEGCDHDSEVWTVYSGQGKEGKTSPTKLKESGKSKNHEKDLISEKHSSCALSLQ